MRILLYADLTSDSLGASYHRAFQQLGHQVIVFDTRDLARSVAPWLRNRLLHRLTIRSLRLRALGARCWNEQFLHAVLQSRPDLTLIIKGEFLMPEILRRIRRYDVPVSILHPDNPFPPHYAHRPETVPCMAESDIYFVYTPSLLPALREAGVGCAQYLPFGWDPIVFPYAEAEDETAEIYDVVFIGGWDRWREEWLAHVAAHFDLKIWGPNYWGTRTKRGSPLRRCWQGKAVRGSAAAAILREAKVALNILRPQNLDGTNMRTFEIPGCGGFSLATRTACALELLPEGEAGGYFSSPEEMLCHIERYVADRSLRQRLRDRAHHIVQHAHTYRHRAGAILDCWDKVGLYRS